MNSSNPLATLLAVLTSGDQGAAKKALEDYEPYLRKVVRRQLPERLRAKFDSSDVVQSVWVRLLAGVRDAHWRFDDSKHLRAFLAQMTRNRFLDQFRKHKTAAERERALDIIGPRSVPISREPKPSEVLQAEELWEKMLSLCPPDYQPILRLRRQGLGLAEIAARTGLHEGSVRRIVRQLSRQLAMAQSPASSHPKKRC